MKKNIIITGLPRSGKSTILKSIISSYPKKVGFVTNEINQDGERIGFEIETHNGNKAVLANIGFKTEHKVSKYSVDINNLDAIIPEVEKFNSEDLLFLDEIGQMELFSEKFKQIALLYLDSPNTCIATLSQVFNDKFIAELKDRDDIILVEITRDDNSKKQEFIAALIGKIAKARRYKEEPQRFAINSGKASINSEHGIRHLENVGGWICDCYFFKENKICSHVIALEEFLKLNSK